MSKKLLFILVVTFFISNSFGALHEWTHFQDVDFTKLDCEALHFSERTDFTDHYRSLRIPIAHELLGYVRLTVRQFTGTRPPLLFQPRAPPAYS